MNNNNQNSATVSKSTMVRFVGPAVETQIHCLEASAEETRVELIFSVKDETLILEGLLADRNSRPALNDIVRIRDAREDVRRKGELLAELGKTSLQGLAEQLLTAGFALVYAGVDEDVRPETYQVRFVFDRKGRNIEAIGLWMEQYELLSEEAFWKTSVFLNPKFTDGMPVEGESTLHLRLNDAICLTDDDGNPVEAYLRDIRGQKVSEVKKPIIAKHQLVLKTT